MNISFGHHELHNRYRFTGELHLETPLRLSSGRASDLTDAPLMRDREGKPYIPGSSLRGALRSTVERIVTSTGSVVGLRSCTLFSVDDCNEKMKQLQKQEEEKTKRGEATPDGAEERLFQHVKNTLCDVCKLFGATVFASRLVIEDACLPVSQDKDQLKTVIRDGVGIDRDTGTAREGVKFDYEVLEEEKEVIFTFRMQVENLTDQDRKLVNLMLALLRQGLYVGGKQAVGLGKIRLDGRLSVVGFDDPKKLWAAVSSGKDPHEPQPWEEGVSC